MTYFLKITKIKYKDSSKILRQIVDNIQKLLSDEIKHIDGHWHYSQY